MLVPACWCRRGTIRRTWTSKTTTWSSMCLKKIESKQQTKQSKQKNSWIKEKQSKQNTVIYNKKVKTKNKSDAAAMLSQILLLKRRLCLYLFILTELKNKNKKRPKWDGKVESLKRKKNYKFDDSYLLLFVYTLSTTITIKKIKYLHYIHSVSKYITTLRYASYYICCCNYLRVPYTVEKPNCRIISLYTFCPKKYFFFVFLFILFFFGKYISWADPLLITGEFSHYPNILFTVMKRKE